GNFTLTLSPHNVLAMTHHHTLLVKAHLGDTVAMGSGWTAGGTELIAGLRYQVFTQGAATLKLGGLSAPGIAGITAVNSDGAYRAGAPLLVRINFTEPVTLDGGPLVLTLNTGSSIAFAPFHEATSVTGLYTVTAGQNTAALDSVALLLGGTLRDQVGNDA